ncbi:uncharacterized protein H6S33_004966 [Morchella sextelata]|uniref:uncharacterized protein n=1 Tax=Morchella sextelata TaxID=1174677 RepID=UPI001D047877|nr:uncharacterized protein H6S33_004966 [Morchella sextelata]KAH0604984.1 hypothetical protein H6S33_004966 [Morchella sextelata]
MASYNFHQQYNPAPPSIPFQVIDDLHDAIIRTRRTLHDCDNQLEQVQATLKTYLSQGDGFVGGALELTYDVLRVYFTEVAEFMPLVSQLEDKEDKLVKLLVATREVVGCLLQTLRYTMAAGGRRNICMV